MKAAVYKEKGQPLVIEDINKPHPGPGQVLIRIKASGICGSDIHASQAAGMPTNIVMGHEFSGIIAGWGEDVTGWEIGQRVLPLPQISCGQCPSCYAGNNNDCDHLIYLGYDPQYSGGFAEYAVVGMNDILLLPDRVDFDEAAEVEPLAVALDSVRRAGFRVGESVLIIGAGPIGLGTAQWARFFGAANVIVSETNPNRLRLAEKMGATETINVSQTPDVMTAYQSLTGTRPNIIFECVGARGMIQRCIDMAIPHSKIVVVGVCHETDHFEPRTCTLKALELIFPYYYSIKDFQFILKMLDQRRIIAKPMISHRISLEQLPDMFEAMRQVSDQCKVIVNP
jgi:(R,R)-butanediol dehydrogenase/meso-butanediol dehydrogenase/diacetyl reductase